MRYLMILGLAAAAWAQNSPCDGEHKGQFDFWVGEWNVFDPSGTKVGENSIQPLFGGCVLQENWVGSDGSKGSSFNFYNPQTKMWEQFWVWQAGNTLHLRGGLIEGSMVLRGETKTQNGKTVNNRITWSANPDGSVRQHWEGSRDGGKTYSTLFDGIYKKK